MYHKIRDYKAAVWTLNSFIDDYPASKYNEKASFLLIESSFELAMQSVRSKQEERFVRTIEYYKRFESDYQAVRYSKKAKQYFEEAKNQLNKLSKQNS